jgi:asparagine synthetase B (glutamine-hydrolysing)
MCGILFSIAFNDPKSTVHDDLIPYISSRGPDSLQTYRVQIPVAASQQCLKLIFTSSVLHLRGQKVTVQPLISEANDVLCWNGEVWQGLYVNDEENDGLKLLEALTGKPVWRVMEKIEGPWAMVYFSSKDKKLWFGRDCLGRRSLVRKSDPESRELLVSSVAIDLGRWEEVEVEGLWCLDLNEWAMTGKEVYHLSR